MTAPVTPEPPKCCLFNIKTATVTLGIFHVVSYETEREDRERETRKERQRCNLRRRCHRCRSQDFSVSPKRKTNDSTGMDKRRRWRGWGVGVGGRRPGRNVLHWEAFLTTFSPGSTDWSSWKFTLFPVVAQCRSWYPRSGV